jgi:hypothetical protein
MTHAAGNYEYAYSDRDVRDNPELRPLVVAYVTQYTGDFDPLVEAKRAVEGGHELTVPQVRRVLNCMRHDFDVADQLPAPRIRQTRATVLDFGAAQKRKKSKDTNTLIDKECDDTRSHDKHYWGENYNFRCKGIPWKINRKEVTTKATVHARYVKSRTGNLVHLVADYPGAGHLFQWNGPRHEYGFKWIRLHVKLVCKYPSWIQDGTLYLEEPVHLYGDPGVPISRCRHCFADDAK